MTSASLPDPGRLLASAVADDDGRAALAGLGTIDGARRTLDDLERRLITESRRRGATWAQVASALGLASRQAAEQRWTRLCGDPTRAVPEIRQDRRRQRSVDKMNGAGMAALRTAAVELHRGLRLDAAWDGRFPTAALVRATLAAAVDSPPGALFSLAEAAIDDLSRVRPIEVPRAMRASVESLREAVELATPAKRARSTD